VDLVEAGNASHSILLSLKNITEVKKMGMQGCRTESFQCATPRNFLTKEERIEMLQEYKDELDKEAQGVAEKISTLKKKD